MLDNGKCEDCGREPQEAGAPLCDDCTWDAQNLAARDEMRGVVVALPNDPDAHPFSGRRANY